MNENMRIWNDVKKTDVAATKANTSGGFKSTSINGYFMIEQATRLWGPEGTSWGVDIVEERFDQGAPIIDDKGDVICNTVTHTILAALWYPGSTKPVLQFGHTPYIYKAKYGPITDTEYGKKSLMDATKKCLSKLGFSADVFTGEFDDDSYIEEITNESKLKKADDKDAEKIRQEKEYKDWKQKTLDLTGTAVTLNELEALYKTGFLKMKRRGDDAGMKEITLTKEKRKSELEGSKK